MLNLIDHLYFRAKFQPDAIALQSLNSSISNRMLLMLVQKVARKLRERGVKPGHVVVTCLPEKNIDWIVTLALFHEATVTCSNHGYSQIPSELDVDYFVTKRSIPHFHLDKTIVVDPEWFKQDPTQQTDTDPVSYESEESLCRLVLTSGTTGQRKVVPLTISQVESRVKSYVGRWSSYGSEVNVMALSTYGGFNVALGNLLAGTPLYYANSASDLLVLLDQFQVGFLAGSPAQLANLINEIQKTSFRLTSLKAVRYGGGPASARLINNIQSILCPNVIDSYSSTEAGNICAHLAHTAREIGGAAGYPLPNVEIQVVDENGLILGFNQEGAVRVKTPYMVHGYFNNTEKTMVFFKAGWFFPGDRGKILKDGMLVLCGREGELINRGGIKIDPGSIDPMICDFEGVEDAAVFGAESFSGVEELCVALVVTDRFQIKQLKENLIRSLGQARAPSFFFRVKKIPRNEMGKPLRHELTRMLEETVKNRTGDKIKGVSSEPD